MDKQCVFTSIGGGKCEDTGHNCDDLDGKYIDLCAKHYENIKYYSYVESVEKPVFKRQMFCMNELRDVPGGGQPLLCVMGDCINIIYDHKDPYDASCFFFPCSFCLGCYQQTSTTNSPSVESIMEYTKQLKQIRPKLFPAKF